MAQGNAFNPDNTAPPPTNWSGRSQGIQPNRAGEVALEGLGNTLQGAAVTSDIKTQADIRTDSMNVFDMANAAFGYDERAGFEKPSDYDPKMVPDEFKPQAGQLRTDMERLLNARSQGALGETHYYSLLAHQMKSIKSKYPGYAEIVDNIFTDVVGFKPANALRQSLEGERQSIEREIANSQDDKMKFLKSKSQWWAARFPDLLTNPNKYDIDKVLEFALSEEAKDNAVESAKKVAELNTANDAASVTKNTRIYQEAIDRVVEKSMNNTMAGYPTREDFLADVTMAATTGKFDQASLERLNMGLIAMEQEILSGIAAEDKSPYSVTVKDRDAIKNNALKDIQILKGYLQDGKFDLAGYKLRQLTDSRTRNTLNAMQDPEIATIDTMTQINPELATVAINQFKTTGDLLKNIGPTLLMDAATGAKSVLKIIDQIDKTIGANPQEKAQLATAVVNNLKTIVASPHSSDEDVLGFVKANFAGDNPPMAQVTALLNNSDSSMRKMYNAVVDPIIADRIAKTGDTQAMDLYASFAASMIDDIPEVNRAIQNLSADTSPEVGLNAVIVSFDSATNQFRVSANPKYAQVGAATDKAFGGSGINAKLMAQTVATAQAEADKVNQVLGNYSYVLSKAGADPNEYLRIIFQSKGIRMLPPEQRTKDEGGSSTGTNPLEGSGNKKLPGNFPKVSEYNAAMDDEEVAFAFANFTDEDDRADQPDPISAMSYWNERGVDVNSLPAGMRNNNPGNLKYSGSDWQRNNMPGIVGPSENTDQGDPQIVFDSPESGFKAMSRLIDAKTSEGMTTVNSLIAGAKGWTPGYTDAVKNISAALGVDPNEELDFSDPSVKKLFMKALVRQEHGSSANMFPDELYDVAVGTKASSGRLDISQQPDEYFLAGGGGGGATAGKDFMSYAKNGPSSVKFDKDFQKAGMQPHFMESLEATAAAGFPIKVLSGHRDATYNRKVKGAKGSRHITGDAADLDISGLSDEAKKALVNTLIQNGVYRFISYSHSPNMLHVDADDRRGVYFMHDKSAANLAKAPKWMKEVINERRQNLSDTDSRLAELEAKYLR